MDVKELENDILEHCCGLLVPQPELSDDEAVKYAYALRFLRDRDFKILHSAFSCCEQAVVFDVLTHIVRRYDDSARDTLGCLFKEDTSMWKRCREAEGLRRFLIKYYPDQDY